MMGEEPPWGSIWGFHERRDALKEIVMSNPANIVTFMSDLIISSGRICHNY
jgi:hypothetical protein